MKSRFMLYANQMSSLTFSSGAQSIVSNSTGLYLDLDAFHALLFSEFSSTTH